jgi:hypothetical protein
MKLKLTTIRTLDKAMASLESGMENNRSTFKDAVIPAAWKEIKDGADMVDVLRAFRDRYDRGSWKQQEMARALKSDAEFMEAGRAAKLFRDTPPTGKGSRGGAGKGKGKEGKGMSLTFKDGESLAQFLLASMDKEAAMTLLEDAFAAVEAAPSPAKKAPAKKAPAKKAK